MTDADRQLIHDGIAALAALVPIYLAFTVSKFRAQTERAVALIASTSDRAALDARRAAARVAEVKDDLVLSTSATSERLRDVAQGVASVAETVAANGVTLGEVHRISNGALTVQLQAAAAALSRVARLTGHPEDERAADLAQKTCRDHLARQASMTAPARPEGARTRADDPDPEPDRGGEAASRP